MASPPQLRTATFSAVVAGSVGGTRALKLVVLAVLDALVRRWPAVDVRLYVDDLSLQHSGPRADTSAGLQQAVAYYVEAMEEIGIPVSRRRHAHGPAGKGYVLAADPALRALCQAWAAPLGLQTCGPAPSWGLTVRAAAEFDAGDRRPGWTPPAPGM